jgi:hypothetical protein
VTIASRKALLLYHNGRRSDMAFVRWRGNHAKLLATLYENGRSKQFTLANLPDFYVSDFIKMCVAKNFPQIKVDWAAVDRVLALGPPCILKQNIPSEHLDYAAVEHCLREWADDAEKKELIHDATRLFIAAGVLTKWRAEFFWESYPNSKRVE